MTVPRRFRTIPTAKRAIKKEGLQNVPHEFIAMHDMYKGFEVRFTCELREDVLEIQRRGFRAVQGTAQ